MRRLRLTAPIAAVFLLAACAGNDEGEAGGGESESPQATSPTDTAPTDTAKHPTPGGDGGSTDGPGEDGHGGDDDSGAGSDDEQVTAEPEDTAEPPEPQVAELPRGGTEIFPDYRLFGYSGHPQSEALGRLGIGDLDDRVREIEEVGQDYLGGRELMPVLELITVVVHPVPMADGLYRTREPASVVQTYLDAAERHDAMLLLNIQPGMSTMIDEVRFYEEFLLHPSVGIALDPEWDVAPGQIPGQVYGHTAGTEIDEVAAYLDGLIEENDLPQKALIYHQVHPGVVSNPEDIGEYDNVVVINAIDGIGHPADKIATYNRVIQDKPDHVIAGFKLFYEEDAMFGPLMTPDQVLELDPQPQYILWE